MFERLVVLRLLFLLASAHRRFGSPHSIVLSATRMEEHMTFGIMVMARRRFLDTTSHKGLYRFRPCTIFPGRSLTSGLCVSTHSRGSFVPERSGPGWFSSILMTDGKAGISSSNFGAIFDPLTFFSAGSIMVFFEAIKLDKQHAPRRRRTTLTVTFIGNAAEQAVALCFSWLQRRCRLLHLPVCCKEDFRETILCAYIVMFSCN